MKTLLFSLSLCLLSSTSAFAQKSSPLQTTYLHQLRNDGGSDGSISVERFGVKGGVPLIIEEGNLLAIGFRYALNRYDFRETTADWGSVHHANIGLASRWKVNDSWLLGNYALAGVSAESGADKDKGLHFSLISIAEYKVNDRLTIGPGIGLSSKIDQDLSVFPIIALNWKINDEWTLASGPSDVATSGANVYVEYTPEALQDKWTFTTGFSYGSNTFKIDSNSLTTDGSAEERLASAYVAASYEMENGVKLSAIAGYHIFQSYSIFDGGGNELSKENLDDAPYFGVSVGFEF